MSHSAQRQLISQLVKEHQLESLLAEAHYPAIFFKQLEKGELLFKQEEHPAFFYIMLKGKISVYQIRSTGKKVVINVTNRQCLLGDVELTYNKPTLNFIELLEDSEFLAIPMTYCREVLLNDVTFLQYISRHLARTLYRIETNFSITTSFTLEKRIFSYILSTEQAGYFELDFQTLPELFGTTYRHFIRVISQLRDKQIIEKDGAGFILKDKAALKEQIEDLYLFN